MMIKEYYYSLEKKDKNSFIKKVIDKCDISYPAFMYKVRDDKWSKLEREAIERIIKEDRNGGSTD